MAELLTGAAVADFLLGRSAARLKALEANSLKPCLAIVRAGEDPSDISYEKSAEKRCAAAGVDVRSVVLPAGCEHKKMAQTIESLNGDDSVHGVLIFHPLPKQIDADAIRGMLLPAKDVDGITDTSLVGVFAGTGVGYAPCTAQACLEILDFYGANLEGRRVVVIGRSLVAGKPAAMMLLNRHATVTICHTRTQNMPEICRAAEILIVSAGRAGCVGVECLSAGQTVIDVGINFTEGGVRGDVNAQDADRTVAAYTPVPGGVGMVTSAVLISHVIDAAWLSYQANLKEATLRG